MDEKTEELRDIFMDITDEDTVTERQEESRGSLTGDESAVDERLSAVIAEMDEHFGFETKLSDAERCRVVRGYYEGDSDSAIADALDVSRRTVFRARTELHLLRDRDTEAPFDLGRLRDLLEEDLSTSDIAAKLDVSPTTVRRYSRVIRAQDEARRVSDRFKSEFEDALTDAGIADRLTTDVKEDGLEDATEGTEPESDVSF